MHFIELYRKNVFEQFLVSLGNFLFVWNSRVFVPYDEQAFLLAIYTLTISFYPLYFALYVQPLRKLYHDQLISHGYLRFVTILVGASVILFVLLALPFYSGLIVGFQYILTAIFFAASYYAFDFVRRCFLLTSASPFLLLIASGALTLFRSSASLANNIHSFFVLNIFANSFVAILLLSLISSNRLRLSASCDSCITLFARFHLPCWRLLAPLGIISFVTTSFPIYYSASLPPSCFVFFGRVRALFAVLNPVFEYLDGSYFLRKSYPGRGESVRAIRFTIVFSLTGLAVSLLLALYFYFSPAFRLFVIGSVDLPTNSLYALVSLFFLLSLSAFVAFALRHVLVLIRRFLLHEAELTVLLSSLPCLMLVLLPVSTQNVAILYLLIPLIQLLTCLYFVLTQISILDSSS